MQFVRVLSGGKLVKGSEMLLEVLEESGGGGGEWKTCQSGHCCAGGFCGVVWCIWALREDESTRGVVWSAVISENK